MHYYPEDQSQKNLEKIRRDNVCAECSRQLAIFIDLTDKRRYIACSGQVHEGIARAYQSPAEDYQSNIRREVELEEKTGRQAATTAVAIPKQGQLTQAQAMHILRLVYPEAPDDEIIRCAILCRDFGLHPLMKEVYIIGFKKYNKERTKVTGESWSTVIGIAANRKIAADKKGSYSFIDDTPRAATQAEIVKQYGKDSQEEADNIISICKISGEKGNEAVGFGLYPKEKQPQGTDKGNTQRNMANIRSERQCIDRLPGGILPLRDIEVLDEAYLEQPDLSKVEITSGEIKEEDGVLEGEVVGQVSPEEEIPQPEPEPEPQGDDVLVTADQITQLGDLLKETDKTAEDMGKFMVDKGWKPGKFGDLTFGQYKTLVKEFFKQPKLL